MEKVNLLVNGRDHSVSDAMAFKATTLPPLTTSEVFTTDRRRNAPSRLSNRIRLTEWTTPTNLRVVRTERGPLWDFLAVVRGAF